MTSETPTTDPTAPGFVPVCAIGASAGGVAALQTLFKLLPSDLGLAYVVVVHLSPDQPSVMHEILGAATSMPVLQVGDGPTMRRDHVYVIAPDSELVIDGDEVTARPFSDPRGRRAPIDMFFRSVAAARGDGIAVVLTGAGSDGAVGVRAIKEAGGIVMVQEPTEAGFPSMPQNAIATGVADVIAPLSRLAERIAEAARSKEAVRSLDGDEAANDVRRIITFLRTRTGHDFSGYKRSTVLRRLSRRMQVCQLLALSDYAQYLRSSPEEAKELLADLLISVTMFFRDPIAFVALSQQVIGPLIENKSADEGSRELRAWVVGCATGEEAYSLAILLLEATEQMKVHVPIQIFATDLDEGALATAREGRYPRSIEADVSAERLKRFFVDEGTHYRISPSVRDLVLFAIHSVVREPPFMRLDVITCRNVLIYLERALQQHVCAIFHYGLQAGGYLFLGSAETADTSQNHFAALDRDARIYRALPAVGASVPPLISTSIVGARRTPAAGRQDTAARFEGGEILGASHAAALEASAPPSALVDADQMVLHLSPTAGRFIQLSAGPLSGRLPSIVREELRLDLELAIDRVFEASQPTITRLIETRLDGDLRRVSLHIAPVPVGEGLAPRAVVFFLDNGPGRPASDEQREPPLDELRHLHNELKMAQEAELAGRIRHESAVQELRASNEELQSLNEEYRSTAEELETSKEELQSINEELQTVNAELKSKLSIISEAHNDLQNLMASSEIGTLFLDLDLRIRMFTPPVAELINVTEADVGRPISNFTHRLDFDGIEQNVRHVLRKLTASETQIRALDGRWFMMRARPYRTLDGRIEGAVITFDDITGRKQGEAALRERERLFRTLADTAPALIWQNDASGENRFINKRFSDYTGLTGADIGGEGWRALVHPEDAEQYITGYMAAVREQKPWQNRNRIRRFDGAWRWFENYAQPLIDEAGTYQGHVGVSTDITASVLTEQTLRGNEEHQRLMLELVPALLWSADAQGHLIKAEPQWQRVTGQQDEDVHAFGWLEALHPEDRQATREAFEHAFITGEALERQQRIRRADGSYHWHLVRHVPVRDDGGAVVRWFGAAIDIDDLHKLQAHQGVLLHELQHRVRNILALMRSIIARTGATSDSVEQFASHLNGRLDALARIQAEITRSPDAGIDLEMLVRDELLAQAAEDDRITLAGPSVSLAPRAAEILALAIHELATNAVKYGALSPLLGHLRVHWDCVCRDGKDWLRLSWEESEVRVATVAPRRVGFGTELIERLVPYELQGEGRMQLKPGGMLCTIELPLRDGRSILQTDAPQPGGPTGAAP